MSGEDISPLVALCRKCHKKIEKLKVDESWNRADGALACLVVQKEEWSLGRKQSADAL
jgi:hypothetical protein